MQQVSVVYTSPLLHADERKMALRARKVSGAFEKRAPGGKRPVSIVDTLFSATYTYLHMLRIGFKPIYTTI